MRAARRGLAWLVACWLSAALALCASAAGAADAQAEAPLVIGSRTVVVFRAALGAFTPEDRAEAARRRVLKAFEAYGKGWTSVKLGDNGVIVELDGSPMFVVVAGDAPRSGQTSADAIANEASRQLQQAWAESRERRDPRAQATAVLEVGLAVLLLLTALVVIWKLSVRLRAAVTGRLARRVDALPDAALASRLSPIVLGIASRSCVLFAWLLSLLVVFVFLAYSLERFALTRAMGEGLFNAFSSLVLQSLWSAAAALPGLFVAALVFLVAWICTQVSTELFNHVAAGRLRLGMLDAHTAPATRHIVNAVLWLFALAMAYPYLPGAQTEAFKGLSVIVGIMVSIGASSLVGQVASGVILVYTRALKVGEYVRILDSEGTVSEVGLVVTRLRSGLGAEIALPNALVLGNVTRNFSREAPAGGFVFDTSVSIGYDTPWRQVHALLLEAAQSIAQIARQPAPYVIQSALADAYVVYRLVVCVESQDPVSRARVASSLHAVIQDLFNRHGVQIMSPSYFGDPAEPKIVPESKWYTAPAVRPDDGPGADRSTRPPG